MIGTSHCKNCSSFKWSKGSNTMTNVQEIKTLHEIQADVNFLVDTGVKPVNIPSTPGGGKSEHIGEYETQTVRVRDARPLSSNLSSISGVIVSLPKASSKIISDPVKTL